MKHIHRESESVSRVRCVDEAREHSARGINRRAFAMNMMTAPIAFAAASLPANAGTDPMFAAVDNHRAACELTNELACALDEFAFPEGARFNEPKIMLYPWSRMTCTYRDETEFGYTMRVEKQFLPGQYLYVGAQEEIRKGAAHIPEEHRADWLLNRLGELRREKARIRRIRKACGYADLECRRDAAEAAEHDAREVLLKTIPTTAAGAAALTEYVAGAVNRFMLNDDDLVTLMSNITKGLSPYAKAA